MSWLGKVLGGSFGYLIGGPIGAVAGAALGHGLDVMSADDAAREQRAHIRGSGAGLDPAEQQRLAFFVSTFSMLAKLAKADGVVARSEIEAVERIMEHNLGLDGEARRFAIDVFNEAKRSPTPFEEYARQFAELFRGQPLIRRSMIQLLLEVAYADGVLHPKEEQLIVRAAEIFGVPYARLKRERGGDIDRFYAVLGASPDDSLATIKKKYRQLAQEHHPDRVIAQGLPEEFTAFANRKFQEIQEAYDAIRAARGDA